MILLIAVIAGLLAGLIRAWYRKSSLQVPNLKLAWLVPIAFIPQWLAFHSASSQKIMFDSLAAASLVSSMLLLLVFAWLNYHQAGIWLLGLGLVFNLFVIVLNGGLMPISPETVNRLIPQSAPISWEIGQRLGSSKDILLPITDTRLWSLSDRFLFPDWSPFRVAFSIGDIFVAIGAFLLLWSFGKESPTSSEHQE